jgi:hypothetical protein
MAKGMWCSASSWIASARSFGLTFGSGIFFMIKD